MPRPPPPASASALASSSAALSRASAHAPTRQRLHGARQSRDSNTSTQELGYSPASNSPSNGSPLLSSRSAIRRPCLCATAASANFSSALLCSASLEGHSGRWYVTASHNSMPGNANSGGCASRCSNKTTFAKPGPLTSERSAAHRTASTMVAPAPPTLCAPTNAPAPITDSGLRRMFSASRSKAASPSSFGLKSARLSTAVRAGGRVACVAAGMVCGLKRAFGARQKNFARTEPAAAPATGVTKRA
mmetsp:Transcript_19536/g.49684  ORF Transcript_19536/g.49684 Transcript_19536/m.49684 type:complete len:247 (-) Transcript_19536:453-1193(-)